MKRRSLVLIVLAGVLLALGAVVGAAYSIENWRGARAWERARQQLVAQGESLDPADFIPPPVPDDQNLAMIPLFAKALDYRLDPADKVLTFGPDKPVDTLFREMPYGRDGKPAGLNNQVWTSGRALPLETLQQRYAKQQDFPHPGQPGVAAEDVLYALKKFAPATDEIERAIAVRPLAHFPVAWRHYPPSEIALPHDNIIQQLTSVYRLRAVANIAAGQHAEAARDVAVSVRLREAIRPEPTLIAHLVNITCENMMIQAVWEGLAARRWTDGELQEIQAGFRKEDFLADYVRAVRSERALFLCGMLDPLRESGSMRQLVDAANAVQTMNSSPAKSTGINGTDLYPRGWIAQNEAAACLGYQRLITEAVDLKARRVKPDRLPAITDLRHGETNPLTLARTVMAALTVPVCGSVLSKSARAQTARDEALTACALERYFMVRAAYPETLAALVPEFLDAVPTDLFDGAPLRYHRTEAGRFVLYSIGWNQRDDGGVPGWKNSASVGAAPSLDYDAGDWVWQYAPMQPPPVPH